MGVAVYQHLDRHKLSNNHQLSVHILCPLVILDVWDLGPLTTVNNCTSPSLVSSALH